MMQHSKVMIPILFTRGNNSLWFCALHTSNPMCWNFYGSKYNVIDLDADGVIRFAFYLCMLQYIFCSLTGTFSSNVVCLLYVGVILQMIQLTSILFYPAYRLYTVVPRLVRFVDLLTNWYVRSNRRRIKASIVKFVTAK